MKYVGVVTDPSWLEPFVGIEGTATYEIWFEMCPDCGAEYEIYRIKQFGKGKGLATEAPLHIYNCPVNIKKMIEIDRLINEENL